MTAAKERSSKDDQPDLNALLVSIENQEGHLHEHSIDQKLNGAWKESGCKSKPSFPWIAESTAFQCMDNHSGSPEGWGNYYGPSMEGAQQDGTPWQLPDAKSITSEMLTYWSERAETSSHPVMKARYAGLVFDLSKIITGQSPNFKIVEIYFNSLLEIARGKHHEFEMMIVEKLERALDVSILMNQEDWLSEVTKEIISYQGFIGDGDSPGHWGFAYRLLVEKNNTKISPTLEKKIIDGLEDKLSDFEEDDTEIKYPFNCEALARPLAEYYRKKNKKKNLERVITIWGDSFEDACEKADGMLVSAWLEHIHDVYREFGFSDKASAVSIKIKDAGSETLKDLKEHSTTVEIPREDLEKFTAAFVDKDLEIALSRLAFHFIPDRENLLQTVHNLAKENPFSYTVTRQIIDNDGRAVASIGSPDEDPEGHMVNQLSFETPVKSLFYDAVLYEVKNKFGWDEDKIMDFIFQSPCFKDDRKYIIQKGIKAFFDGDFIVSAHLLVPQIEAAVRNLLEMFGGAVLEKTRMENGFKYKTLDKLLREEIVVHVLGENLAFYIRATLTDTRGLNLRNEICHGLVKDGGIDAVRINKIIHILLCLGLIRPIKKEAGE